MRFRIAAVALFLTMLATAPAHAATDHVVLTGGATVARGEVAKNVVVLDGSVSIAGRVTGEVVAVGGPVTISGSVKGNVTAVSERVRLLGGARVGGDLLYGGPKPFIASDAQVSGKVSDEGWTGIGAGTVRWVLGVLWWLAVSASTLLLGTAFVLLVPRAAEAAWRVASERTRMSAAWAAGLFFGLPIAALLAIATAFGLPLGVLLLLSLLPLAAVGYVATGFVLGRVMLGRRRPDAMLPAFFAGWAVLRVVALAPFLGALAWIVASAFGLGVLLLAAWHAGRPARTSAPTPAPATVPRPAT